ncbi:MAG: hypothetical protein CMM55_05905 [Rhodospirillaceae bacterium]|nr:hypothetical protein [Rhodospirillaceae bacterium]
MFGIRCWQRFDEAMVRLVQRGAGQDGLHFYHSFGDLNRALAAAMSAVLVRPMVRRLTASYS